MIALWYATRAFGLVAMVLLTAVTALGLLVAARRPTASLTPGPRRPGSPDAAYLRGALHRSLSLVSVVFVALHVATSAIDGYVPIRWADALVPFVSAYHPFWLGLGTVALDLVIALIVTSLVRARLGVRAWRAVHWLAYAAWPIALVHGFGVGTDRRLTLAVIAGCLLAVALAAVKRLLALRPGPSRAAHVPTVASTQGRTR